MDASLVIQAGGISGRMGQNKALMRFLGEPLIGRVVGRLARVADEILIVTNDPADFSFLQLPIVQDVYPGTGPLGGLYTALKAASRPLVCVVACDLPFASPALLKNECDMLVREDADVVIPASPEGLEPLFSAYRREACLPVVQAALENGQRRMISWFHRVNVRKMTLTEVSVWDPDFRSFINVNTPDEFSQTEHMALTFKDVPQI